MTIIEQIKTEIERRKGYISVTHFAEDLLSFLSTLESEKPMQEGLDEEINLAWEKLEKDYSPSALDKTIIIVSGLVGEKQFSNIARHFAQWGAEHRGSSEITKDLDEAAEKYQDDHTIQRYAGGRLLAPEFDVTIKEVFIAGAKCQKEQMMKEAVEGEVCGRVYDHINVRFADGVCKFLEPKNISHIPADVSKYKIGDKVRIIIVKEGEK